MSNGRNAQQAKCRKGSMPNIRRKAVLVFYCLLCAEADNYS